MGRPTYLGFVRFFLVFAFFFALVGVRGVAPSPPLPWCCFVMVLWVRVLVNVLSPGVGVGRGLAHDYPRPPE